MLHLILEQEYPRATQNVSQIHSTLENLGKFSPMSYRHPQITWLHLCLEQELVKPMQNENQQFPMSMQQQKKNPLHNSEISLMVKTHNATKLAKKLQFAIQCESKKAQTLQH